MNKVSKKFQEMTSPHNDVMELDVQQPLVSPIYMDRRQIIMLINSVAIVRLCLTGVEPLTG